MNVTTANLSELVERFKQSNSDPSQFLADLLAAQCLLGLADGGAILRANQDRDIDVLALYPRMEREASAPTWLSGSSRLVRDALTSGSVLTHSLNGIGSSEDQNGRRHVIVIPLNPAGIGKAVAAFVVSADSEIALDLLSQRLQLLTGMMNHMQTGPSQQSWQQRCQWLRQATETLSAVNRQQKFTGAAMAFCNEVASQWQCERVSLGFLKGRYIRLKALSHTEDFSRKMQIVQDIEAAMEECLDQDVEVLSPASPESTTIHRAADTLSKRHGPMAVLSLPLRWEGQVTGVLTLERPIDKAFNLNEIETVRLACELCTARLANLYLSDRWLGAKIALGIRNGIGTLVGPKYAWAKLCSILCCAAIAFLIFGKGTFRAKAPFILESTQQQVIPAPFDGYIKNIEVEVGDNVEGGTSVLGDLDTAELRLQLAAVKAEKAGYLKQASAAMRDGKTAQAQIAQADADKAQAQIELLEYQIRQASLVSPISGVVVQGDLKRQIGAPVAVGDVLFEVCPLESLRAQLMIPEDEIYDIKVGQEGYLATASYPAQRIKFVVERVNPIAEVVNQRNVFKVRVELLQTYPWIRPGMEGVAKVDIGKRRYVWIWTRKIVNWIRMKLWL
ncbi:MAG: HlyD family efflux transporter periplasmic adaptor subunit [Sedimentisphaerales bacterium]|nr:HlyD family efflux transporter periplasmic adaptor subunit [Sedimentisphaerales bacterium]